MNDEQKTPDPSIDSPGDEMVDNHTLPLPDPVDNGPSRISRLKAWYLTNKKLTIPATALLFIVVLAGIPLTRYKTAGLVLKQDYSLKVVDSTTNSPVSEALVSAGSISAFTDGNGRAILKKMPVGTRSVVITKKHYKNSTSSFLVPIMDQKSTPNIALTATGRQVLVKVLNYVTKKPLAKVDIKIAGIDATTDKDGQALLVLPANAKSQDADLSLENHLNNKVKVTVSEKPDDKVNTFSLVPAGKIYFMSKRTGKLDLMKSNIDGSDTKVVLAGTGTEQDHRTSFVPSADFEYAALVTKRSSSDPSPQLFLITADEKLKNIDSGNAEFNIIGWSGKNLVYTLVRYDLAYWQQGKSKLKSYDAESGKITLLDQSAGSDEATGSGENYVMTAISGATVSYAKNWTGGSYYSPLTGKQHSLHSILINGQNHRLITSYDAEKYTVAYRQKTPAGFYIIRYGEGEPDAYYEYSVGDQPKQANIDQDKFYDSFPTYVSSPNGQLNTWSNLRDGKDVILVGDSSGNNGKPIASLDEHSIYGWFTNDYILLSKKNSELYVISVAGGEPVKITDYQSVNAGYDYY